MFVSDEVTAAVLAVANAQGEIEPAAVVEAARSKKSPLHDRFEWDDSVAGHQYRLQQARHLIKLLRIDRPEKAETRTVAFVRNPAVPPQEQGYIHLHRVPKSSETARQVVLAEMARVTSALNRARGIAGELGLEGVFDELISHAERVTAHINNVKLTEAA